jgi:hypothetical protein
MRARAEFFKYSLLGKNGTSSLARRNEAIGREKWGFGRPYKNKKRDATETPSIFPFKCEGFAEEIVICLEERMLVFRQRLRLEAATDLAIGAQDAIMPHIRSETALGSLPARNESISENRSH